MILLIFQLKILCNKNYVGLIKKSQCLASKKFNYTIEQTHTDKKTRQKRTVKPNRTKIWHRQTKIRIKKRSDKHKSAL